MFLLLKLSFLFLVSTTLRWEKKDWLWYMLIRKKQFGISTALQKNALSNGIRNSWRLWICWDNFRTVGSNRQLNFIGSRRVVFHTSKLLLHLSSKIVPSKPLDLIPHLLLEISLIIMMMKWAGVFSIQDPKLVLTNSQHSNLIQTLATITLLSSSLRKSTTSRTISRYHS